MRMREVTGHLRQQLPVLSAIGRVAFESARTRVRRPGARRPALTLPGPVHREVVPARPRSLIESYLRHIGAFPGAYPGVVPPALFPQWCFPLQLRALIEPMRARGYDLARALNGGVSMDIRAPLPDDEPLQVTAQLVALEDTDTKVVLTVELITETSQAPRALVVKSSIFLPRRRASSKAGKSREAYLVPVGSKQIDSWRVGTSAGLQFALLTGDFNPIHWVGPAAKLSGFNSVIMHGFSAMGRAIEAVIREELKGDPQALGQFACRFTRPLELPANVRVFVRNRELWVGEGPNTRAFLTGSFVPKETA